MSFQSLSFLAFLAVTLGVCLPLGRRNLRWGQAALTLFCLVFYVLGGGWAALLVLLAGAVVTVAAVRYLTSGGKTEKQRRAAAAVAIVWHVAVLLVFKYTGFFTGGAVDLGWAPLGLSFFTFQQIWCIKEVYTGAFRPESTGSFLLYDFFFPSVTSGPILKPENFFPQLTEGRFLHPTWEDAAAGVYAIAVGTIKKVLLADPFGVVVNNGWAQLGDLSAPAAWLVILGLVLFGGGRLMLAIYPEGTTVMCVAVPLVALAGFVYYLYQREFFFSGLGVGLAVGGMWLAHRAVGSAVWGRQYVAIEAVLLAAVVVLLILAVAIGKNGGKWGKGDAARTVFSGTTNYSLAYGALAAAAAAIVLGIIAPACALYLLWAGIALLFVLAVYYTMHLM